ncbi:MAG TPA: filamentous hemagglutinin N-terminal domain-containing protein, partial [Stenomitos sp.]
MIRPVFCFWRAGYLLFGCLATASSVQAQIVPDDTLPINSRVAPGCLVCTIDEGTQRGVNLFHSFSEFSIPTGGEAFFNNALQIQNIFSRVTGNSVSNIDGLLRTNGTASLFFLNPSGVIFGQNARLEIGGSFFVSTASSLQFPDGSEFSATNPQAPPLLTVNVTPGVQWGANQPQTTITNRGNLAAGQDLTLSAGNLDLQGQLVAGRDLTVQATDTVKVRDSSTSPFIASSGGKLLVEGNQAVDIFTLNHPASGLFSGGNMVLRSANTVGGDAHYWSGGSFRIEKLDGSLGDLYSPYDPIIRSVGDVSLNFYTGTSLHILAGGAVNIGTVVITGAETGAEGVDYIRETVPLSNGTEINIDGSLQPTLDIRAGVAPAFIGVPGITGVNFPRDIFLGQTSTNTPTSATITIGDVLMNSPNSLVFITNQYQPNTTLPGGDITVTGSGLFSYGINLGSFGGNSGSVVLDSRGNIVLKDSIIASFSTVGNAGNITLLANDTVSLTNNSFIASLALNVGNAGNITVQANGTVSLMGSGLLSSANVGNSGNITMGANDTVAVTNNSFIASSATVGNSGDITMGANDTVAVTNNSFITSLATVGNSGDIILRADKTVSFTNSFALSTPLTSGDGGNMNIQTRRLLVTDGAQISISTLGQSNGGSLIVNASDSVEVIGINNTNGSFPSPSSLTAQTAGAGNGGNIEITTPVLRVTDGAGINMTTVGEGKGGNLIVDASEFVEVTGSSADGQFRSTLDAQTFGAGDGGNIEINTPVLRVTNDALVNVNTRGEGKAGNVIVTALESVEVIGAGLGAQTTPTSTGNGGNVEITSSVLRVTDGGVVSASTSGEGKGGKLTVDASESVEVTGSSADGQRVSTLIAVTSNRGDGGNVEITTPVLRVTDGGVVSVGTLGEGKGGNLIVHDSELVQVMGTSANGLIPSSLDASTYGTGDGGNVEVTTSQLLITDGAQVSANTFAEGKGGNVIVNDADLVQLIGISANGQLPSILAAKTEGAGDGGNVEVTTSQLLVTDGAQVSASTIGAGKGGSVIVNASDLVQLIGTSANGQFRSSLDASTSGTGDGGNVKITTSRLLVTDGARVSASTLDEGKGGSVTVNASQQVQLNRKGGLFVDATAGGIAGDLFVNTNEMSVTDGAQVNVSSPQGQAGNLNITANSLTLNQGTISAETGTSGAEGGANITLSGLDFLRMDNESLISASALGNANGGNVTIDSTFIVATPPTGPEGSDIIANADRGNGGRVNVTTQGLFGIQFRPQRTPKNDITVSSTFGLSGTFALNTPGVDPSRGLAQL